MALFPHCGLFSYSFDEPKLRVWLGLGRLDGKLSGEYSGMGFKLPRQTSANPLASLQLRDPPAVKTKAAAPTSYSTAAPCACAGILRELGVPGFPFPMKPRKGAGGARSRGTERTLRAGAGAHPPEPGCDIPTPARTPPARDSPEEEEISVALHDGVRVAGEVAEAGEVEAGAGGHLQHAAPRLVAQQLDLGRVEEIPRSVLGAAGGAPLPGQVVVGAVGVGVQRQHPRVHDDRGQLGPAALAERPPLGRELAATPGTRPGPQHQHQPQRQHRHRQRHRHRGRLRAGLRGAGAGHGRPGGCGGPGLGRNAGRRRGGDEEEWRVPGAEHGGLRAGQAGMRRGEGQEVYGSRDAKGRDGERQRCERGREAKGRAVSERGAKGEVKREGYKGEGCKGRVAKRRNAKGRGGQDGGCKEGRCRRAEIGKAGALRGEHLAAPRALEGEGVARRGLEVQGSPWSRGLCTAFLGKKILGNKICLCRNL